MSDNLGFDPGDEPVMELVLSSDDEFTGTAPVTVEERRLRRREVLARFIPGVDAGAVFALGVALLGMTSLSLVETIVQNDEITGVTSSTGSSFGGSVRDQWAPFRDMDHARFLGQGAFALLAVVVAVLVTGGWRAERHARWSRPVAQAALLIGLAGVVIALLGYFNVIATLPSPPHPSIQDFSQS